MGLDKLVVDLLKSADDRREKWKKCSTKMSKIELKKANSFFFNLKVNRYMARNPAADYQTAFKTVLYDSSRSYRKLQDRMDRLDEEIGLLKTVKKDYDNNNYRPSPAIMDIAA